MTPDPVKPRSKRAPSALGRISQAVGLFRWAFMPLGLLALIAVGVHTAADSVDDRLRLVVDQVDAFFDGVFAQFDLTRHWVDAIGSVERTHFARGVAFIWELLVDAVIALPALGYFEAGKRDSLFDAGKGFTALLSRLKKQPTPMRVLRPFAAGVFAIAGAYAVARMVEGSLFVALRHGIVPDGINEPLARIMAAGAMVLVLASFGWRAVLRSLQHADEVCVEHQKRRVGPWTVGFAGTALAVPLALAALLDTPVLSFFR